MKTHVIAHKIDLDGIVCHALFERKLGEVEHRDIAYGAEDKAFDGISAGDKIYFCDLGFNNNAPQQRMLETMKALRADGSEIELYDHHNWPAEILGSGLFTKVCHDKSKSSSVIVAAHLMPQDSHAVRISNLAHCDDFSMPDSEKDVLVDVIQSGYNAFKLAHHLAFADNGSLVPADAQEGLAKYHNDKEEAIASLRASYQHEHIRQTTVSTGLSRKILYMKPGWRIMCTDNPEHVIVTCYEGVQNVLFEARTPERFAAIVKAMAGGGRGTGGGFAARDVVSRENYAAVREDILTRLKPALE